MVENKIAILTFLVIQARYKQKFIRSWTGCYFFIFSDNMYIKIDNNKYLLLDNNNNILIECYNIVDFNFKILCNFKIKDIVNYETFLKIYKQ